MILKRVDEMKNKAEHRKKEIIVTAMKLFSEKGYEQTSMRDIARTMNVSLGLCYRYFDSKQALFNYVIDHYIVDCCSYYLKVLHDSKVGIVEKIDILFNTIEAEHIKMEYYDFFHQIENSELHEQLSIKLCKYMYPHLLEEVQKAIDDNQISLNNPEVFVSFITYGQIGILSKADVDHIEVAKILKHYVYKLLNL